MRLPVWIRFSSIFWKIFLSFWATMILITLATTLLMGMLWESSRLEEHRKEARRHRAETTLSIYESGGPEALTKWLDKRKGVRPGRFFLLDDNNNDVLGRPLPQPVIALLAGDQPLPGPPKFEIQNLKSSASHYRYVSLSPPERFLPERLRSRHRGLPPKLRIISIMLSIFVTGIISYALARNITSPVRALQRATRRISSGDLKVRVQSVIGKRRDELGQLSADFDRMAEQIERLLMTQRRMLGDVSHELRSPLARLQVALELARKSAGRSANIEHNRIETEANRLEELIGQVMALVRLEGDQANIIREEISLAELLGQIVQDADFEARPEHKAVKLKVLNDCRVKVNEELIYSALENIVRNALKYTKINTCVEVLLGAEKEAALIQVRDHGAGVCAQTIEHLVEPFYREAQARDRASGGYGLGLAIAQRAINIHEGSLKINNTESGGLMVEIRLPI